MDLPVIQMSRQEARRAFLEYRSAVRESLDREVGIYDAGRLRLLEELRESDEALMRGYRQLSLGHQVISLPDTIRAGGEDSAGRPRLAIARADARRVALSRYIDGSLAYSAGSQRSDQRNPRTARSIRLPRGTLSRLVPGSYVSGSAVVPTIPPRIRPRDVTRYHILFEAEWGPVVPRDPALLRALGDGLYAVLATWNLTELERAVLGIRMS